MRTTHHYRHRGRGAKSSTTTNPNWRTMPSYSIGMEQNKENDDEGVHERRFREKKSIMTQDADVEADEKRRRNPAADVVVLPSSHLFSNVRDNLYGKLRDAYLHQQHNNDVEDTSHRQRLREQTKKKEAQASCVMRGDKKTFGRARFISPEEALPDPDANRVNSEAYLRAFGTTSKTTTTTTTQQSTTATFGATSSTRSGSSVLSRGDAEYVSETPSGKQPSRGIRGRMARFDPIKGKPESPQHPPVNRSKLSLLRKKLVRRGSSASSSSRNASSDDLRRTIHGDVAAADTRRRPTSSTSSKRETRPSRQTRSADVNVNRRDRLMTAPTTNDAATPRTTATTRRRNHRVIRPRSRPPPPTYTPPPMTTTEAVAPRRRTVATPPHSTDGGRGEGAGRKSGGEEKGRRQQRRMVQQDANNDATVPIECTRQSGCKCAMCLGVMDPHQVADDRKPCPTCSRKFATHAFQKHVRTCTTTGRGKRGGTKTRKIFDSATKRARALAEANGVSRYDSDKLIGGKGGARRGKGSTSSTRQAKRSTNRNKKWSRQSEQLRAAMRAARTYKCEKKKNGGSYRAPPPTASAPDPSLIPCEHCGRRFNENAHSRHVKHCKHSRSRPKRLVKGGGLGAGSRKARLKASKNRRRS